MKKNDYLVCKMHNALGDKPHYFLARAIKPANSGKGLIVSLEKDKHWSPKRIEVELSSIVLNLGKEPEAGMVYGQDLEHIYRGAIEVPYGILVHKFSAFEESVDDQIKTAFTKAFKILKSAGLLGMTQLPMLYEVKQKTSKYAGFFKARKDMSVITLCTHDLQTTEINSYVLLHEIAHALDHFLLNSKELRARWVKLYMQSVKSTTVTLEEARAMWKPFTESTSVGHWKSAFEDDAEKAKTNLIVRMIKQAHGITARDINALMDAEEFDVLKPLWPREALHSTEFNPLITEYATRNVKETLAEAVALYLTDTKLPKVVVRLVEDTIQHAIGECTQLFKAD